ncbi:signal peptidase I, partial [Candidatus Kaiserbacteria bacterium]|nr:signal peptidase I [Candidatus Kaiserbacteria bacterium]
MKFLRYIVQTFFTLTILSVVGLFVLPYLPIDTNVELRIVQSGSMEPAISTGSLILVWPQTSYRVGDVIMFEDHNAAVTTTHSIVDIVEDAGVTRFVTQGDANEDPDNASVATGDIYGAVAFSLPKAGFVLDFARQPVGFMLLIVLPALLLIVGEIEKIWKELRRRPTPVVQAVNEPTEVLSTQLDSPQSIKIARSSSSKMMDIMTPVRFQLDDTLDLRGAKLALPPQNFSLFTPGTLAVMVGAFGITTAVLATQYLQLGSTYSYLTDTETSEDNSMQAIAL